MYSVSVRDSVMIAHSLKDEFFGPAQSLHGATYVVDVEFQAETLDEHNVVIDIGKARELLRETLKPLAYRNLDEVEEFAGKLTTAEFVARYIHDTASRAAADLFRGRLHVRVRESHDAWVGYQAG